jgi:sugar lactone lactonase YvrE
VLACRVATIGVVFSEVRMNISWARALGALLLAACTPLAQAWDRSPATTFATLPAGAANPEGIAVDAAGRVYVATFAVGGTSSGVGQMFVFGHQGQLLRQIDIAGSSTLLLDLAFHPVSGALLVIDFGNKTVLDVNPANGAATVFATIPGGANAGPNSIRFDAAGNVYISDSFQGKVWRTGPGGGAVVDWVSSPLLQTTGVPPFGANGLAFNRDRSALFVANTGNDTVVKIPLAGGVPGTPAVFVHSVNGADGLLIDEDDNLWIAANQADEIVVVNPSGRVIAKLGDFNGLDSQDAPRGLLFPASLVRHGEFIYVTNLALDLRLFGLPQPVDAQWAADVKRHTVAKIRARIPAVSGLAGKPQDD